MSKRQSESAKRNRYVQIIESVFHDHYEEGTREIRFARHDLEAYAERLRIKLPKNLGDILYTFRYRGALPASIVNTAPERQNWIIRGVGRSQYCFALTRQSTITPNENMVDTTVPNSTPGLIESYALNDEQALLAKLRYNRLIDVFTGTACYSLQSHLRTSVSNVGQVETDEVYVGIDRKGVHYVFPVQAKGGRDHLSAVQIEQDLAMCQAKFPGVVCRPIAAQFMSNNLIALFELVQSDGEIKVLTEKHYRLVPSDQLSSEELSAYQRRAE
jgi:hypothetical protein